MRAQAVENRRPLFRRDSAGEGTVIGGSGVVVSVRSLALFGFFG